MTFTDTPTARVPVRFPVRARSFVVNPDAKSPVRFEIERALNVPDRERDTRVEDLFLDIPAGVQPLPFDLRESTMLREFSFGSPEHHLLWKVSLLTTQVPRLKQYTDEPVHGVEITELLAELETELDAARTELLTRSPGALAASVLAHARAALASLPRPDEAAATD